MNFQDISNELSKVEALAANAQHGTECQRTNILDRADGLYGECLEDLTKAQRAQVRNRISRIRREIWSL
jgi:hypothetical protein